MSRSLGALNSTEFSAAMRAVAERGVIEFVICITVKRERSGSANGNLSVKPGREPSGGEITSENDDMSSDKQGERPCRRKSKGSCLKLI